jgi:heme-degrading monooxygenase HmoA
MIKVMMERNIGGKNVPEIVRLLRQLRVKAMQQPGYITGETLHSVDNPNYYVVMSSWDSKEHWDAWVKNPERKKMSEEIDNLLESPTKVNVLTT